ncbi:TPA_asm: hypothetical protein G1T01_24005 [Salmonella enterica subsp. enterica serovar Typhi str. CT18]|uniref:Uncharacterized protein n=1 Tax=Salmonella enterica subsp. enterica serovar Typhi str. CT18 TaxID=220341 RepID=A0A714XM12_SALTI|nr:hypothetical protein [Salmonella enterica]EFH9335134.1 hypothetical protein [Escherichia coli]RDZ16928.1 hypothetical protein DBP23_28155 [Enterobacter sp. EC-NT1]HAD4213879.1 hypothetical protein [Salmonella enterica subsp. enterica serovar Typhi str. CT18]RBX27265.1 hypothetical protein DS993_28560 [Escherichia coli]
MRPCNYGAWHYRRS